MGEGSQSPARLSTYFELCTSLKLLTHVLGIPSPKEDIEGKDVCMVYYEQQGLKRIVEYCQRDVVIVARLLKRFRYETDLLEDKDVIIATQL